MIISELLPFLEENKNSIKIHFAKGKDVPERALQAYLKGDFKNWQEIQKNPNFECDYILSLIRLGNGEWLFAGIYKSFSYKPFKDGRQTWYKYKTKLMDIGSELIGRVIVGYKREFRQSYCWLETCSDDMEVLEIRRDPYKIPFLGYDKVRLTWEELYAVINTEEWKKPLLNRKGVYLITDMSNGKMYVGSATGRSKLWRRWSSYVRTYNGGNKALKKLKQKHIRENFQYTILDTYTASADDTEIRKREQWWKDVLKTKEFGYNEN